MPYGVIGGFLSTAPSNPRAISHNMQFRICSEVRAPRREIRTLEPAGQGKRPNPLDRFLG
jgi:hypothetical protein